MMDRVAAVKRAVTLAVIRQAIENHEGYFVPVAVTNRHVHLSAADLAILFGPGYQLKAMRPAVQPGQYICEEQVTFAGPQGRIENIRVLGPVWPETNVELNLSDTYRVGVVPVIRIPGNLEGTPGGRLIGPAGEVQLARGVMVAARHLHLSEEEAVWFGLKDGDRIKIRKDGDRAVVLENIVVRVGRAHALELHIDIDEANAAGIECGELLKICQ